MEDTRIAKLRDYLFGVVDEIINDSNYQINVDMLSNRKGDYSLDKIPTRIEVESWIIGYELHKDIFLFRSRRPYSQDTISNLENIGFFETFENIIKRKNEARELPDIEGIENIKCLNCGTLNNTETNTAEFNIQIQITYRKDIDKDNAISL